MIEFTLLNGKQVYIAKRKITHIVTKGEQTFVGFGNANGYTVKESVSTCVARYTIAE